MKTAVTVVVLCLISGVSAQEPGGGRGGGSGRGGGGRGGGRLGGRPFTRPPIPGGADVSTWNRTLDGQDVSQSGFASDNVSVVIVKSRDRQLSQIGRVPAETLYGFSSGQLVAVRSGSGCYLLPVDFEAGLTFQAAADEVNNRNGTTVGPPTAQVQLNATGEQTPATVPEAVTRFCRRRRVVLAEAADTATFPTTEAAEAEGNRVLKFDTLNTDVQLLARGGRGPGGRGPGGRQGGGGRGRGGQGA